MAGGWQGRHPVPGDWAKRRRAAFQRAGGQCQAVINGQRCTAAATDCDHVIPISAGGTSEPDNLAALCHPHHLTKSKAEAVEGRRRAPKAKRAPEQHPGLL